MTIRQVAESSPEMEALAPWFVIRGNASVTELPIVRKGEAQAQVIVEALRAMERWQKSGVPVSAAFYTKEMISREPEKAMTNLLFMPGRKNAPFVLILSGGGYSGVYNIGEGIPCAYEITRMGYNVFILTYRVDRYPVVEKALEDVAAGLSYILNQAEEYGVSTENYAIMGMSAGGHLAASWGLRNQGYGKYGLPAPAAELLVYGAVSTLAFLDEMERYEGKEDYLAVGRKYMGLIAGEGSQRAELTRYSVEEMLDEMYPPTYVVHCVGDDLVPVSTAYRMEQALEAHAVKHQIHIVEGGCHGFGTGIGMEAEGWLKEAVEFWVNVDKKMSPADEEYK